MMSNQESSQLRDELKQQVLGDFGFKNSAEHLEAVQQATDTERLINQAETIIYTYAKSIAELERTGNPEHVKAACTIWEWYTNDIKHSNY